MPSAPDGGAGPFGQRPRGAGSPVASWRRATHHRRQGRPLAAERAYRIALAELERTGSGSQAAAVRAEYASLLVELGRDKDAADLSTG